MEAGMAQPGGPGLYDRLRWWTNVVAWVALAVGVITAITLVATAIPVFIRENNRFAKLNGETNTLRAEVDACWCDTFFFDDMFSILNRDDPTKRFFFNAGNITSGFNRTYTMPNKDGTVALLSDLVFVPVFLDSAFAIQNDPDTSREFMFDAALISASTTRIYAWPNKDGTVALLADIPVITSVFEDDVFAVQNAVDMSKEIMFDVSGISAATTRTFTWPNKDGTVALLADIANLTANATQFLDSAFAILNDPDTTKIAMFDASVISTATTRTFIFPNLDGILALTTGVQTITDKVLDNTNSATLLDTNLILQDDGDVTKQLLFDVAALSTGVTITATLPPFAVTASRELMFTTGTQTVAGLKIFEDTALQVRDSGTSFAGTFDASTLTAALRTYILPDGNGTLALLSDLGPTFLDSEFAILNVVDPTKVAAFDASLITTATTRTYSFPDLTGTLFLREQMTGFHAISTASQSIPSPAGATLLFQNSQSSGGNDPGGDFDNTTGTYTIPLTGYYTCATNAEYPGNGGGGRVSVNLISGAFGVFSSSIIPNVVNTLGPACASAHILLSAADTVTVLASQITGSSITVPAGAQFGCWMVEQE